MGLLLLATSPALAAGGPVIYIPAVANGQPATRLAAATQRTVNVPYLNNVDGYEQMAIFWYGRVTHNDAYSDVRVSYDDKGLTLIVATIDRLIWHADDPAPSRLADWDAVSLLLRTDAGDSNQPDDKTYRIDVAYNFNDQDPRSRAVYRGNGTGWSPLPAAVSAQTIYRGDNPPNSGKDGRGWVATINVPFSSLGLQKPANGAVWRMAMSTFNRNAPPPAAVNVAAWPERMTATSPASWGILRFGLPGYAAAASTPAGITVVRRGLNNAEVIDANVGGYTLCGGDPSSFWTEWGERNWAFYNAERSDFNVQNQSDIADWPCFAKYYTVFPLNQVPAGKVIRSATLTFFQFSNAQPQDAKPSMLQVMTVDRDFDPKTINWNNAPMALENVGRSWVDVLLSTVNFPGVPRVFDVGYAVAQAYATGQPLRLAVYSSSRDYHSGKYFVSSGTGDWNALGRPTLTIEWGNP
jgi:hypothetical protein